MLFCTDLEFETWSPDFSSSGLSNPIWTRVRVGGTELCNSLKWIDWKENPVQVQLCDACGTVGCASGGYVHLTTLENIVLWTMPQIEVIDEPTVNECSPASALDKFGAVAFENQIWEALRVEAPNIPASENLLRANGRAMADAWAAGPGRPKLVSRLVPMLRKRLLAADTLEVDEAIQWIEHWLDWFGGRANISVEGTIRTAEAIEAKIERLYFDGPGAEDWSALARLAGTYVPAFDSKLIFVPNP